MDNQAAAAAAVVRAQRRTVTPVMLQSEEQEEREEFCLVEELADKVPRKALMKRHMTDFHQVAGAGAGAVFTTEH